MVYISNSGTPHYSFYQHTSGGNFSSVITFNNYTVPTDSWHHVAIVRDISANTVSLFVNGQIQQTSALGTDAPQANTQALEIGEHPCDQIDILMESLMKLRIYNTKFSPSMVTVLYNYAPAPVGYWKFDEGKAGIANNSGNQGSAYNGSITGATWTNNGKLNKALHFDGDDYVEISGLMGSPTAVTLTGWANLTAADTSGAEIISLGDAVILRLDDAPGTTGYYYNGSD